MDKNNEAELNALREVIEHIADPAMALEDLKDAYAALYGESDALTNAKTKGELMDVMQVKLRALLALPEEPETEETE
jgi:hypothetical protein